MYTRCDLLECEGTNPEEPWLQDLHDRGDSRISERKVGGGDLSLSLALLFF